MSPAEIDTPVAVRGILFDNLSDAVESYTHSCFDAELKRYRIDDVPHYAVLCNKIGLRPWLPSKHIVCFRELVEQNILRLKRMRELFTQAQVMFRGPGARVITDDKVTAITEEKKKVAEMEVFEKDLAKCRECGKDIAWLTSRRTGKKYRVNAVRDNKGPNQGVMVATNIFHDCGGPLSNPLTNADGSKKKPVTIFIDPEELTRCAKCGDTIYMCLSERTGNKYPVNASEDYNPMDGCKIRRTDFHRCNAQAVKNA